jgi:hypothetical protein
MKDGETTKKNLDFSRKKYTVVIKIAQKIEILINKTIPDFFCHFYNTSHLQVHGSHKSIAELFYFKTMSMIELHLYIEIISITTIVIGKEKPLPSQPCEPFRAI